MGETSGRNALIPMLQWGESPMTELRGSEGELFLPVGTVTLLLSDIEGSTRLWESDPEGMTAAVERLDEVLPDVIGRHGGVRPVEQGEGDSFVAAFARATDALDCALELQRIDLDPIHLRMGLHTGEVQLRDQGNYIGEAVNRCARVRELGHGGQVLLSGAARDLVVDRQPPGAWLRDLGSHQLRDLSRPESIYQLGHPDLRDEFPALRSLDAYAHNLPSQLTTFVGRAGAVEAVSAALVTARLVTLVGSGGCGKTRLALQVAAESLADQPDGAWLVELAPVTEDGQVAAAAASAVGLREDAARDPTKVLGRHFASRRALLVLDNCEHVVAGCAQLADDLLRACPGLTILATSREPLAAPGELTWRVPSLECPGVGAPVVVAAVTQSEAVQLFVERARRVRPEFEIDAANAGPIADICRRLDGIPLAIELAAARVRVLPPERIAAGLGDRFRLLTGAGTRTAVPRQATLQASVDWSHELLAEPERVLFRRLAVFSGPFDLDAAEAVGAGPGLESHQVLDQLALLIDKSLVVARPSGGLDYSMLETIRQYGLDRLAEADEEIQVRDRHRDHHLTLVWDRDAGIGEVEWEAAVGPRLDNMRAALRWSLERDPAIALRMTVGMGLLFTRRGLLRECRTAVDAALAGAGDGDEVMRLRALTLKATSGSMGLDLSVIQTANEALDLARKIGDPSLLAEALMAVGGTRLAFGGAGPYAEEAIEAARAGDGRSVGAGMIGLGLARVMEGEPAVARRLAAEGRDRAIASGNAFDATLADIVTAMAMLIQGDLEECLALMDQAIPEDYIDLNITVLMAWMWRCIALAQTGRTEEGRRSAEGLVAATEELGQPFLTEMVRTAVGVVAVAAGDAARAKEVMAQVMSRAGVLPLVRFMCLPSLALAEVALGDIGAARAAADQAVQASRDTGIPYGLSTSLLVSAYVALAEEEVESAERMAHEALGLIVQLGDKATVAEALEVLAASAAALESSTEATRILGAAHAARERASHPRFQLLQPWYDDVLASLRAALSEDDFAVAWAEGTALSCQEAAAYAARGRGERRRPSSGWASLTPAELDVVGLVAEGLPNKAIAERLFISARTVQAHLTHVYAKLGLTSRVQLAKEAMRPH